MDLNRLTALGFTVCGGQLDFENTNYGYVNSEGPVLTVEGTKLVNELTSPKPSKRDRKAPTAVVPVEAPVEIDGLDDDAALAAASPND